MSYMKSVVEMVDEFEQEENYLYKLHQTVEDVKLPDTLECCIYCGTPRGTKYGCCGESHFEFVNDKE